MGKFFCVIFQQKFLENHSMEIIQKTVSKVLDKHAPLKKKIIRGNEKLHMNKALKKVIMKRSRLRIVLLISRNSSDLTAYKEQRNLVTKMNNKTKRDYFNIAIREAKTEPKAFWKFCKPFLSDKSSTKNRILLAQDGEIIQDNEVAKLLNGITSSLNLFQWNQDLVKLILSLKP